MTTLLHVMKVNLLRERFISNNDSARRNSCAGSGGFETIMLLRLRLSEVGRILMLGVWRV